MFFSRPSQQTPVKTVKTSVKTYYINGEKKLEFCYKQGNRKIPVYQGFDVDVVLPACNFIKNYTLAQTFSFEFCEFYQADALLKKSIWQRCLLPATFFKNETPAQVFSYEFWEIFQPATS